MGKFGTREMLFIDNKMLIYICETKADSIQMSIIALVLSIASELVWPLDTSAMEDSSVEKKVNNVRVTSF